ncbi:MAG: 5'-methylthioadenosine/S-adenosylhomocysteine nucleosidase [Cellulosilyticaceae bacterium]
MNRDLLIQGAMEEETKILIEALENPEEITLGVWQYTKGYIEGWPVVISRTRIGMTNAAASTALAIEHFKPAAIINQGTAGGHDPKLHTGDLVIAKKVVNLSAFKTPFKAEGEGIMPTTWEPMALEMRHPETKEWEYVEAFEAHEALLRSARTIGASYKQGQVVEGVIGSADLWNKEIDRILWLNETLETSAEEMEAAAVAQVAACYGIPFLCIRILSNNEIHMEEFDPSTGQACQTFVLEVAKHYIGQHLDN